MVIIIRLKVLKGGKNRPLMMTIPSWQNIKAKTKEKIIILMTRVVIYTRIITMYLSFEGLVIKTKTTLGQAFLYIKSLRRRETGNQEKIEFSLALKNLVDKEEEFAFCLTDIIGSTKLWNELEDDMNKKVRKHSSIGFRLAKELGGYVSKMEGDSFFVVFNDVKSAIEFGKRIIEENKLCTVHPQVDLRVGVAVGKARVGRGTNYMFIGEAVKKVYSLNDRAHPNTILIDDQICLKNLNKCM